MFTAIPGFSPLAWFGSLSPEDKSDLVRQLLREAWSVDPHMTTRLEVWRMGKTARLEIALPLTADVIIANLGIHFAVEDADAELWNALESYLESKKLEFIETWNIKEDREELPGWAASFGIGSVAVYEKNGELALVLSRRQPIPVPVGVRPGAIFQGDLPDRDGSSLMLKLGQFTIMTFLSDCKPEEARAARKAPVKLGLVKVSDGLLILGAHIKGLWDGWADMPFSICIEAPENRKVNPPESTGRRTLSFIAIDRETRLVIAMRLLTMSVKWTKVFDAYIDGQMELAGKYSREDYIREVEASYRRWPNPNDMAKEFAVAEVAREDPFAKKPGQGSGSARRRGRH